ncbi:zinc finger and BTB domain-containing protein 20-like isoform X2 [Saccostrea echinata]|uniref:zinc finger and BTB domain-containing protein 20-like isoform X2 n=1 Tax=Saccostrea echinata TaxID=191078 RepID=UPI002A80ACEF|nr:zinc finger and BTB domain-containing protein 20-like isoform X2 [Saccostrea echinata]
MLSNCYQKFYTNQIHSSSLLYQLSTMWKSQVLCDAVIRSGSTVIKAHRVILVAACPMLQSMEKSSIGSHLEVRLASDIAADSINTFLQYLYEGFMMLTEENCKEVEKIARLLQVDSVIKCCADFSKCVSLKTGTGNFSNEQYRYTFHDMIEFRHVRSSDLQKTVQDKLKRPSTDFLRAGSPSTKRPKHFRMGSPSDISVIADRLSMAQSYAQQEKQVNHSGAVNSSQRSNGSSQKQPVFPVEIVEDSIELVQTEVNPDTNTISVDEAVSVGIASQIDNSSDLQVIDISKDKSNHPSASNNSAAHSHHPHDSITVNPLENFANTDGALSNLRDSSFPPPLTSHRTLSTSSSRQTEDVPTLRRSKATERPPDSLPLQAMQHLTRSSNSSLVPSSPVQSSQDIQGGRSMFTTSVTSERGSKSGRAGASQTNDGRKEKSSLQGEPDLSIVKSETMDNDSTPGGLEMYVDSLDEPHDTGQRDSEADDTEGDVTGDWNKEDLSMEGNITGDQTMWVDPNFKGCSMKKAKKQNTVIGLGIPNESLHFLSVIHGCKKLCAYCLSNKIRTKAGWFIYTKFKCNYCNVPLCQGRSGRLCHLLYHKHMAENFEDTIEEKEEMKPLPDHLLYQKTENFVDPEGGLPDQEQLATRRKHPRKGRVPPIQFTPDSNNEQIDLESGNEEDDDLLGPFLYDETGIEPEGSGKPI